MSIVPTHTINPEIGSVIDKKSVMVLLASKEGSKVVTVACPKCGRISRQILRNEYKNLPLVDLLSSHYCPVCNTEYSLSSSAESTKYSGLYARYILQGEQTYNSDIKTAFISMQNNNTQTYNGEVDVSTEKAVPHLPDAPKQTPIEKVMICSVTFPGSGRSYDYISNDLTIKVNDRVIVPTNDENIKTTGIVTAIGFYARNETPYPIEKTKAIIGKASSADSQPSTQDIPSTITSGIPALQPRKSRQAESGEIPQVQISVTSHTLDDAVTIPKVEPASDSSHSNKLVLKRKVDNWKKQLLDLSKRNKMINYHETKRATLKILEPDFTELFNRLAVTEEELTFQRPIDKDSDIRTFSMLSLLETLSYPIPVHVGDIKTEGSLLERKIALNNLHSKSKLARDEQGTNILYLSFGFIEWRENNSSSAQWLKSPVLMVPVSLKLESIQAPYTLLRYDDDIEVNPTLDYLFNERYGIDLPTFELNGEDSIDKYMQTIEEIADQHGWKLLREVSLGLLSFLKISMYHDLNNNYERMLKNPVIRAITGDTYAANNIPSELAQFDFDRVSPNDCYQVVNSDSSQQEAILLSKAGVSFVMQGPPGTGKSQTITNIIAEALADGKTILFVSEKAAALQVVYKRLIEVELDDFCLALHSHKANKKEILDSIATNLKLPHKKIKDSAMFELTELFQDRLVLNQYVRELHEEILPLEKSLYDAYGELSNLQDLPYIQFSISSPSNTSSSAFNTMLYRVSNYSKALKNFGRKLSENPWSETVVTMVTQSFRDDLLRNVLSLPESLLALDESLSNILSVFELNETCTWNGALRIIALSSSIESVPLFPLEWANEEKRVNLFAKAKEAKSDKQDYLDALGDVLIHFNETIFNEDLSAWLGAIHNVIDGIKSINEKLHLEDKAILERVHDFQDLSSDIVSQLEAIVGAYEKGTKLLSFSSADTLGDVSSLAHTLSEILNSPAVKREWFDPISLEKAKQLITTARTHAATLLGKKNALLQEWEEAALNIDSDAMLLRFKTEYTSFLKIFKAAYRSDIKTIRGASKRIGVKFSDGDIISLLQRINEIKAEIRWFSDNQQLLNDCFGNFYIGEVSNWTAIDIGLSFTERICSVFPQSIVPKSVINMLCDKATHASDFAELANALSVMNADTLKSISEKVANVMLDYSEQGIRKNLLPSFNQLCVKSKELVDLIHQIGVHATGPISNDELLERVAEACNVFKKRNSLDKAYHHYLDLFGNRVIGLETDWDLIISDLESVSALFASSESNLMADKFMSQFCNDANYRKRISMGKSDLQYRIGESGYGFAEFRKLFATTANFDNCKISDVADRVSACINNIMLLDDWISCIEAKEACDEIGLADFTEKIEQYDNSLTDILSIFKRGFFSLWMQSEIGSKKTVEQFRRHTHDEIIKRFVSLDERQLLIAQERIRQNVISRIPDTNRFFSANDELSVLQREIGKKRRIMPLRKLFKSIPNLLLKLKPCMMMSPLSVAYFLEAESYEFDMVIFDEASQIFPQDAIGSIFRGKQVIIAGDSKQLPPSNFFATSTSNNDDDYDEEDEDAIYTEIYDSILEETTGVLPNRTLLWHYRSKHENLIAFSNQEIYKNELVTFPSSVNNGADTGVEFVYVENGFYEGKGRNISEARRCVELVRQHIEKTPGRSLGIIAFSENQQKTISLEIQKFREQHPEYESFFVEDKEDEFFVKNLENVQGDERDTIIFSVSYAKTKEQHDNNRPMALRFGPLGQKGGERRLNVAITRAKTNVKLVSSILPSDVDLGRTESEGVKMLRHYIEFAMNGSSALRTGQIESEKDVFVDVVAEYLVSRGYKIKKYVGCSGYKIDIGVIHPDNDNCFIAGIECDGLSYAASKSARDRDHLRKSALEARDWRIYRVWSPEWMARQDIEGQKLLAFIDTAIKEFKEVIKSEVSEPINNNSTVEVFAEDIETDNAIEALSMVTSFETDLSNPYGFTEYTEAVWHNTPNIMQFYGDDRVAEEIKYIVGIEQPIYIDLLYQRMAGAFGNQKATAPVRNAVDRVIKGKKLKNLIIEDKDGFVTMAGFHDIKVRIPTNGSSPRQINFISPYEIGLAMLTIAEQAIGLTSESLIDATTKALGYARKGERMVTCMNNALERLVKEGRIKLFDGKVRVIGGKNRG